MSPLKLQKLLYFAHGWHLAIVDAPLLDEHVEAWQFGPVVPSVYHEFKNFGNIPITGSRFKAPTRVLVDGKSAVRVVPLVLDFQNPDACKAKPIIDRVWSVYKAFTPIQLSSMTHQPDSPWDKAWKGSGGRRGTDIDDEAIKEYFKGLLTKGAA